MSAEDLAFYGGLAIFFLPHLYSAFRSRGENDLRKKMRGLYMGVYSLISLIGFALMVWGYGQVRNTIQIWDPPVWTRDIVFAVMPFALILLASAYGPPGWIKKTVRHPMLTAVKLWAAAHLAANGDLASIVLFGSFLVYGIVDRIALKRRGDVGAANATPRPIGDVIAVFIGLALFAGVIFWFHPQVIGVSVLPSH